VAMSTAVGKLSGLDPLPALALACAGVAPLAFLRGLRQVARVASCSIAAVLGLVVVAVVRAATAPDVAEALATLRPFHDPDMTREEVLRAYSHLVPRCVQTFCFQVPAMVIVASMANSGRAEVKRVTAASGSCALVANLTLGFCVSLAAHAHGHEVASNYVTTLPHGPAAVLSDVCVLCITVPAYCIMFSPVRYTLLQLFFGKNEAKQEASRAEFAAVTVLILVGAILIALYAKLTGGLGTIISVLGTFCGSTMAYLLPGSIALAVRIVRFERSILALRNAKYFAIVAVGILLLVGGFYGLAHPTHQKHN